MRTFQAFNQEEPAMNDPELCKARSISDALAAALMGEYSRAEALAQWAADLKLPDNQGLVERLKSEGIPVDKWSEINAKIYHD